VTRVGVFCAIAVGLCSSVGATTQTAPGTLSPALRSHLQSERFQTVTSIRGLPLGVRDRLQQLFGSGGLDIAEPGAAFRQNDAPASSALPLRRLVAAGCATDNHCLVYYERGGGAPTRRVALFHWTPAETRFEWGGSAPGGLATIEDVRSAIAAGKITGGQSGPW